MRSRPFCYRPDVVVRRTRACGAPGGQAHDARGGQALALRALVAVGALVVVVGCGGLRARRDGTVDSRALGRLERIGQRDMRCREAMRVVQLTNVEFQVDGCGQLREYAYMCVGRRRCDWQPVVPAVGRATVDMQCAIEQLAMAAPTATQRDFLGCGRAASYQLICTAGGCTWVSMPPPAVATAPVAPTTATLSLSVGDPTLETAVIPPPPGSAPPPQDVTPAVDPGHATVPPPPSSDPSTAVVPPPPR